jgi:hypothetical protein
VLRLLHYLAIQNQVTNDSLVVKNLEKMEVSHSFEDKLRETSRNSLNLKISSPANQSETNLNTQTLDRTLVGQKSGVIQELEV